jgi:hypothetical protein
VTDSDHKGGEVCDGETDGHSVKAFWYANDGEEVARASVGGNGKCDRADWNTKAAGVKVCEITSSTWYCTNWHDV